MREFTVRVNGEEFHVEVEEVRGGNKAPIIKPQALAPTIAAPKKKPQPAPTAGNSNIVAPMPGTILEINLKVGDKVNPGDTVVILEAMKLENNLTAETSGTIKAVHTSKGASVNPGDLLVEIG